MGSSYAVYETGSGSNTTPMVLYPTRYQALYEFQSPAKTRRKKPKGIELLFNGTSVVSWRQSTRIRPGRYVYMYAWQYPYTNPGYTEQQFIAASGPSLPLVGMTWGYTSSDWSTEIRKKIVDLKVNVLQNWGEREQAINMFVDYGSRVLKAAKALRSRDATAVYAALTGARLHKGWKKDLRKKVSEIKGRSLSHVFDTASDSWLAWQYGIRPIVSDLGGAMDLYFQRRKVLPLITRTTLPLKKDSCLTRVIGSPNGYRGRPVNETLERKEGRVTAYCEIERGDIAQWGVLARQLGLTNPILLVWELIPYSFVIDWFLNVGDCLMAFDLLSEVKRSGVTVTGRYKQHWVNTDGGAISSGEFKYTKRDFTNSIPLPTLKVNSHPFGTSANLSVERVFSALALTRQLFSSSHTHPTVH